MKVSSILSTASILVISLFVGTANASSCCNVIADKETCLYPAVAIPSAGITTINGVNATTCCEDPSVVNIPLTGDTWCSISAGKSEEMDPNANVVTESSSSSSVEVTSSSSVEQTESHSAEESHSSTSTTTTDGVVTSNSDCSEESGICVCEGVCPDFTYAGEDGYVWNSRSNNIVNGVQSCVAMKEGGSSSVTSGGINVNGKLYDKLKPCPGTTMSSGTTMFYGVSVLVSAFWGVMMIAL